MIAAVGAAGIASIAAWAFLKDPLPQLTALSEGRHVHEPTGLDGIHCWKVEVSEAAAQQKMQELELKSMGSYPRHDTSSANCHAAWWDIAFPREAQSYSLSESGSIRRLAAYKNGALYVTHEYR